MTGLSLLISPVITYIVDLFQFSFSNSVLDELHGKFATEFEKRQLWNVELGPDEVLERLKCVHLRNS